MSPSYTTFYSAQMMLLHTRYGLSSLGKKLLMVYDEYYLGQLSEADLGRTLRYSDGMKRAASETIAKCVDVMGKHPEEQKRCVQIIHACTKMLELSDEATKSPEMKDFPFGKLPLEIRRQIYREYTSRTLTRLARGFLLGKKYDPCICTALTPRVLSDSKPVDLALARTAKWVRREYMDLVLEDYRLNFPCCCILLYNLKHSPCLMSLLRSVRVHWAGRKSPEAFKLLAKCDKLQRLEIVISKSTTYYINPRESEMRSAFQVQKPARLWDALGLDELLEIRGVQDVQVAHIQARQGLKRTDNERELLSRLLSRKLNRPRNGGESYVFS